MNNDLQNAVRIIGELIAFQTTPDQPTLPLINYVESILADNSVTYWKQVVGDGQHAVLLARIGPEAEGGCLLSGHIDVVSSEGQQWTSDPFQLRLDDQKIYGRGACDMKGFVGCVLALIPYLTQQKLLAPIYLALTCDEETKMLSIHEVLKLLGSTAKPRIAILGEPTSMEIVGAHKGAEDFTVEIVGRAAHGSRPDLGNNAINAAGKLIAFTEDLQEQLKQDIQDERLFPPYATVSIGKIDGGNAINTIAERCCVYWNVRQVANSQSAKVVAQLEKFMSDNSVKEEPALTMRYSRLSIPALEWRCDNPALKVGAAIRGGSVQAVPFATEAGYYQQADIDCIVCGPGNIEQAHKPDEFVEISQIEKCLDFVKALTTVEMQLLYRS